MPKVKYDRSKGLHQVAGSGLELLNDVAAVTADGTTVATAVDLTKIVSNVSGANGSGSGKKGVVLPDTGGADLGIGDVRVIVNLAGSALNVFGATATQKIEGVNVRATANGTDAYALAANSAGLFIYTGSTTGWIVVQGA